MMLKFENQEGNVHRVSMINWMQRYGTLWLLSHGGNKTRSRESELPSDNRA